ncbi:POLY [Hepatospora eriocheir]|uniref:POLY n=1 Tax=Hepatospora eriocheir TaxID=1081669 RepID=A0A1X0Q9K6_9MICR|nr:POLY [Hepatospora eriocheir]
MSNNKLKIKIKSIFESYLQFSTRGQNVHRINLSCINDETNENIIYRSEQRPILVEYLIEGTDLKLKRELYPLDNIQIQDVFEWVSEFRDVSVLAKWEEAAALQVLRSMVSKEIRQEISSLRTVETCLFAILKLKYPSRLMMMFLSNAKAIRQRDYTYIASYSKTQCKALQAYFISCSITKAQQNSKLEELFFENLEPSTKMYLLEKEITTKDEAITKIQGMEGVIIQMNFERISNDEEITNQQTITQPTNDTNKQTKWCTKHSNATHNTSECFSVLKKKSKSKSDSKKSLNESKNNSNSSVTNNMIIEPCSKINSIEVPIKIGKEEYNAVLDTGASVNYVSDKICARSNLNFSGSQKLGIRLANGDIIQSLGSVKTDILIKGIDHTIFKGNFRVVKDLHAEVILGLQFLMEQGIKIDLNDMTLTCENETIFIRETELKEWNETPDAEIINIPGLFHLQEDREFRTNILNIVKEFKELNPELGMIPNVEFTIEMNDTKPIRSTPFSVPYKQYDVLKNEINRLEKLGIIRKSNSNYGSPAFCITKKNGKTRLVVDL